MMSFSCWWAEVWRCSHLLWPQYWSCCVKYGHKAEALTFPLHEPYLSPTHTKARFQPVGAPPKGYRKLSGSGNRRETSQLSHPRLCDDEPCRLIGGPRKQGSGERRLGAPFRCSSGAVPGGVLVTLPPRAKSLAARRRRNSPPPRNRTLPLCPPQADKILYRTDMKTGALPPDSGGNVH